MMCKRFLLVMIFLEETLSWCLDRWFWGVSHTSEPRSSAQQPLGNTDVSWDTGSLGPDSCRSGDRKSARAVTVREWWHAGDVVSDVSVHARTGMRATHTHTLFLSFPSKSSQLPTVSATVKAAREGRVSLRVYSRTRMHICMHSQWQTACARRVILTFITSRWFCVSAKNTQSLIPCIFYLHKCGKRWKWSRKKTLSAHAKEKKKKIRALQKSYPGTGRK